MSDASDDSPEEGRRPPLQISYEEAARDLTEAEAELAALAAQTEASLGDRINVAVAAWSIATGIGGPLYTFVTGDPVGLLGLVGFGTGLWSAWTLLRDTASQREIKRRRFQAQARRNRLRRRLEGKPPLFWDE